MPLRKTILVLAVIALSLLAGCKKKKPNVPPPPATAPTITAPEPEPPPVEPPPTPIIAPEPTPAPDTTPPKPTPKPRPHPPKKPAATTPPPKPASTPPSPPSEIAAAKPPAPPPVVPPLTRAPNPQSGAGNLSVIPGLPHDEAIHGRMTTDQLLQSSDQNLRTIKRALSADEQEMVQQIRLYMQQSRTATNEGDPVRARNLALKAHVLSDALVKP